MVGVPLVIFHGLVASRSRLSFLSKTFPSSFSAFLGRIPSWCRNREVFSTAGAAAAAPAVLASERLPGGPVGHAVQVRFPCMIVEAMQSVVAAVAPQGSCLLAMSKASVSCSFNGARLLALREDGPRRVL